MTTNNTKINLYFLFPKVYNYYSKQVKIVMVESLNLTIAMAKIEK